MTEPAKSNPLDELTRLRRSPAMVAWQTSLHHLNNGRHAAALAGYRELVNQFPGIPQLWAELGLAAGGDLEFGQADQAFQKALQLAPNDATLLLFIGTQYYHLRRLDQALACLKRAVAADPSSTRPRLALGVWLERNRKLDEAWESVEACLSKDPKESQALYLRAFLLHRKGLNKEAESALRDFLGNKPAPSIDLQFSANHLLAVVLDGFGQYAEALAFLGQSKALRRSMTDTSALEQIYAKMDRARRELLAELTPGTMRRWRGQAVDSPSPHPLACLGGAARSGTTLIEQIIGANPEILVFDETYSFEQEVANTLHPPGRGLTLKSLDDLDASGRSRLIGRYFKSLLRETQKIPKGRLLLDKNPSLTGSLPLWLRLFPESKVVIALRDPRDVIVSCYFQNFPLSWSIVGFLSLEGTARYYSDCMDVWLRLRELGGFEWIETRYEDVIGNLEVEGRRLMAFLGLPWDAAQTTYFDNARRKFVHSPTYNEVTKPVHSGAVGRWRHYAEALAPLQESLAKYCLALGYG